ncbi:hypothetical protein GGR55DRAFT_687335 [Xylaria sp. FL0064]|nr:hypothetical protein GGR55DRAFT_687335 [Xylaria sp. FL0064]
MTHDTRDHTLDPTFELPWYQWWVLEQMSKQPRHLLLALPGHRPNRDSAAAIHVLWGQIQKAVLASTPKSIDSITEMLISHHLVDVEDSYEAILSVKDLVFAVIGLQTMLYQPHFDPHSPQGYRILDEMSGYAGTTRMSLYQPPDSSTMNLPDFLLGFGVMLPPPNYCAYENDDDKQLFSQTMTIGPTDIDAHVLSRLCGVRFQWVDSLACHLELDKHSGTLYIYRYPSFCVSCLQHHQRCDGEEERQKSSLHACAYEKNGPLAWANEEDVDELLREILLSYRLRPFASVPKHGQDLSLEEMCGRKRFNCPFKLVEREEYDLAIHFPHLRSRIAQLSCYASSKKPRSLRRLWDDRRDSPA